MRWTASLLRPSVELSDAGTRCERLRRARPTPRFAADPLSSFAAHRGRPCRGELYFSNTLPRPQMLTPSLADAIYGQGSRRPPRQAYRLQHSRIHLQGERHQGSLPWSHPSHWSRYLADYLRTSRALQPPPCQRRAHLSPFLFLLQMVSFAGYVRLMFELYPVDLLLTLLSYIGPGMVRRPLLSAHPKGRSVAVLVSSSREQLFCSQIESHLHSFLTSARALRNLAVED